jgi:energy-coupling factor transporter ATP-binding protein EcfA2
MSQIVFQQATRTEAKARVGIAGPAGSGKTKTALIAAFALVGPKGKVFVIDTENNSASLYADEFPPFVTFNMTPEFGYAPKNYIAAIEAAEEAGADAIIIDSASHEWMGEKGALEMVDNAAAATKANNKYNAWNKVTPEHRRFMEKIIRSKSHVIATFRSKMEYEKNDKGGYDRIGLQAITREGGEYEFTLWIDMDTDHQARVTKSRCTSMSDKRMIEPGAAFFEPFVKWLAGVKAEDLMPKVVFEKTIDDKPAEKKAPVAQKTVAMLVKEASQYGYEDQNEVFGFLKKKGFSQFNSEDYDKYVAAFQAEPKISEQPQAEQPQ